MCENEIGVEGKGSIERSQGRIPLFTLSGSEFPEEMIATAQACPGGRKLRILFEAFHVEIPRKRHIFDGARRRELVGHQIGLVSFAVREGFGTGDAQWVHGRLPDERLDDHMHYGLTDHGHLVFLEVP